MSEALLESKQNRGWSDNVMHCGTASPHWLALSSLFSVEATAPLIPAPLSHANLPCKPPAHAALDEPWLTYFPRRLRRRYIIYQYLSATIVRLMTRLSAACSTYWPRKWRDPAKKRWMARLHVAGLIAVHSFDHGGSTLQTCNSWALITLA